MKFINFISVFNLVGLIAFTSAALFMPVEGLAFEKSVRSSVSIQSSSEGGESRAEVHMRSNVNGEVSEFHKVIEGNEAENFHKVFTEEMNGGHMRTEVRIDTGERAVETEERNQASSFSVPSPPATKETSNLPNNKLFQENQKIETASEARATSSFQTTVTAATSSGAQPSNPSDNKGGIINSIQQIFAYVLSIFNIA